MREKGVGYFTYREGNEYSREVKGLGRPTKKILHCVKQARIYKNTQ